MNLVFGTYQAGNAENEVRLLAASLRAFGRRYAGTAIQVGYPAHLESTAAGYAVDLITRQLVAIPAGLRDFPFAGKVFAAAAAEAQAERNGLDLLAWLDADTLILQEPTLFDLPAGIDLACCPVHHRLIGSAWGESPDEFWQAVYQACDVPDKRLFRVRTHVEEEPILPYFNAGMLVTRPEAGLFRSWAEAITRLALTERFQTFYERDSRYRIFMHQVLLTGTILNRLTEQQIRVLPSTCNYPLHLHQQVPAVRQPDRLDDLVTARYDCWEPEPGWRTTLPTSLPLAGWMAENWDSGESIIPMG